MIYFYTPISPHQIENLHNYLHNFFLQLFNGNHPTYSHPVFIHPDFQIIINNNKLQIDDKLNAIYTAFNALTDPKDKLLVQTIYNNNNDISGICNNTIRPYKYSELPPSMVNSVKELYNSLWDPILTKFSTVISRCGTVKSHFNEFRRLNSNSVCPFCGLEGLLCEYDDGRDDYDHYIPKAKYPFCCVNFNNLIPVCHNCNSKNKGQTDTPFNEDGTQRLLYFPYQQNSPDHNIILRIFSGTTDLSNPKRWTIKIYCSPNTDRAKKDSWLKIYKIQKRYKARIAKDAYKWKDKIIKDYSKRSRRIGFNFPDFKNDKLDEYDDIYSQKEAIIKKCFHEFILNDPNCESNLTNGSGII